jgi:hypothetical protein
MATLEYAEKRFDDSPTASAIIEQKRQGHYLPYGCHDWCERRNLGDKQLQTLGPADTSERVRGITLC